MAFKRENIGDYYLRDTHLENIFINEYMPQADGVYVKVYIFALMYAGHDSHMTNETIAKHLGISVLDVLQAWDYWEKQGVIKKFAASTKDQFDYSVEFASLKELVYSKGKRARKAEGTVPETHRDLMENDQIKRMYSDIEQITGRFFEGTEPQEILSWISDYKVAPEFVTRVYKYCVQKRNNSKAKYVASVVREWIGLGLKTVEQVEEFLEETDNRHYIYRRVLKSMGLFRHPTEEEKRIMDTWFDEMDFTIETVLEACKKTSGITNPNINYINSVLKGWKSGSRTKNNFSKPAKATAISTAIKSYEEVRAKNELESERRRLEIYAKIPRIKKIEEEIRSTGLMVSKLMLSGSSNIETEALKIRKKADGLNEEKAYLLTENNYRPDYLDPIYDCILCKDTGVLEHGGRCQCFAAKLTND
jgi:DnaD/phage-associated family protein